MAIKQYKPIKIKPIEAPKLPTAYDPSKQVEGYKTRIDGSGQDFDEKMDKRNFLEKVLNLTPDQNVLFDVFETIERPQRAFFGAVKAAQEGGDVMKAIGDGISGKDAVQFKTLMHNMGMEDSGKSFGADDVVGFLGEVFADPIDLAIIGAGAAAAPLTLGGSAGAAAALLAAKTAGATHDVLKAVDTIKDAGKMIDAAKAAGASKDILKAMRKGGQDVATKAAKTAKAAKKGKFTMKTFGSSENVDDVFKYAVKNNDGATIMGGKIVEPSAGFHVATDKLSEQVFDTVDELKNAMKGVGKQDYGIWKENGKWYLDTSSKHILDAKGAFKTGKKAEQIGVMDWAKKAAGESDAFTATGDLLKQLPAKRISPLQLGAKGAKKAILGTAKIGDIGISKVLTKYDEFAKVGFKAAGKSSDEIAAIATKLSQYTDIKESAVKIMKFSASLPKEALSKIYKVRGSKKLAEARMGFVVEKIVKNVDDYSAKVGRKSADVGEDVIDVIEYIGLETKLTKRANILNPDATSLAFDSKTNDTIKKVMNSDKNSFVYDDIINKVEMPNGEAGFLIKDREQYADFQKFFEDEVGKFGDDVTKGLDDTYLRRKTLSKERVAELEDLMKNEDFMKQVDISRADYDRLQDMLIEDMDIALGKAQKGQVRHAITPDMKALAKENAVYNKAGNAIGEKTALKGNMNTVTGRVYKMSRREANDLAKLNVDNLIKNGNLSGKELEFWNKRANVDLFEKEIQKSAADYVANVPNFAASVTMMDAALVKSTLGDDKILHAIGKNADKPHGFQVINSADLKNKLKAMNTYMPDDSFTDFAKSLPNGSLAIDENVWDLIGRMGRNEEPKNIVKFLDTVNLLFKKNKLLSPGFQMRNFVGNASNMYLAGIPITTIAKNSRKASKILKRGDGLLKRSVNEGTKGWNKVDIDALDTYKRFIKSGFHDVGSQLYDLPPDIAKKLGHNESKINAYKKLQRFNARKNEEIDKMYRMALMMAGENDPRLYQKLGLNNADELVRKVLFDPNDLSKVEKDTLKKVVPFYTFAKKNLAFQMQNVFDNPVKYKRLKKSFDQTWQMQGIDPKDIEGYKRENFWFPVPGLTKDGKYTALKFNLPLGDLAEFASSPLKKLVSSVSPAIRAPFELATNKQVFTGRAIKDFKGQKGYMIPSIGRTSEYLLGQSGLDVPASLVSDVGGTAMQGLKGQLKGESGLGILDQATGRSLTSSGDVAKAKLSKDYSNLQEVQELMKYYKQENIDILTLAEMENKNTGLSQLEARLSALYGGK